MISLANIQKAAEILKGKVIRTPLIYSPTFSSMSGAEVYLKLENLQGTGSFKLRGATFKIQSQHKHIGPEGVVAASAGNHAQGVALAAKRAGLPATVVMLSGPRLQNRKPPRVMAGMCSWKGKVLGTQSKKHWNCPKQGRPLFILLMIPTS